MHDVPMPSKATRADGSETEIAGKPYDEGMYMSVVGAAERHENPYLSSEPMKRKLWFAGWDAGKKPNPHVVPAGTGTTDLLR